MKLYFFRVNLSYCEYLRNYDNRVPYVKNEKINRPFIGILLEINKVKYYAPLTSPKSKHLTMKNQEDFLKIDSGLLGCINFNNMIPIHEISLIKIDMKIRAIDHKEIADYKNLLTDQLSWCNSNRDKIIKKAKNLYYSITTNSARKKLKERCCDFIILEQALKKYCKENNIQ